MIAFFHRRHAGADIDDDAGAFVAENRGKQALRIGARERELVGVADAGGFDLDQHFAGARAVELDGGDFERFAGGERDGGTNVHEISPVAKSSSVAS